MADWIDVIAEDALTDNENIVVDVEGIDVAIFKLSGKFYALEDTCTHDGAEIASGKIEGAEIICPRHGARFCIKTGAVKCAPAYEDIDSLQIRLKDGRVQVKDNRWD